MRSTIERRFIPALSIVLVIAGLLRFWNIATRPGYDWDESVYQVIGSNMAQHDLLQAKTEAGFTSEAYLYHPPLYFMLLGLWFRLFGTGIPSARVLAAGGSLLMLVVVAFWLRRLIGDKWALVATAILAIDGWVVFTARVGWIENTMMPLGIVGLWLYTRALKSPSLGKFVAAGAVLGLVAVYKHVGIYFVVAVLINWLIIRVKHGLHTALIATIGALLALYVGLMSVIYGTSYWSESTVQVQRILGMRESRGTINSFSDIIDPLVMQYKIFVITVLLVAIGLVVVIVRVIQAIRGRNVKPFGSNPILFSFAAAGLLCFGLMQLWLPHYFIMVIVPVVCYLASELQQRATSREERETGRHRSQRRLTLIAVAAMVCFIAANTTAFAVRIAGSTDNALKATAIWTENHLPREAQVVTEESIGSVITQPYCKIAHAGACHGATYMITYNSHTQQPPRTHTVNELLASATKLKTFRGFKEDITILRLDKPIK